MSTDTLIALRGISKYYTKGKSRVAVRENINLSIPADAFVALVGRRAAAGVIGRVFLP